MSTPTPISSPQPSPTTDTSVSRAASGATASSPQPAPHPTDPTKDLASAVSRILGSQTVTEGDLAAFLFNTGIDASDPAVQAIIPLMLDAYKAFIDPSGDQGLKDQFTNVIQSLVTTHPTLEGASYQKAYSSLGIGGLADTLGSGAAKQAGGAEARMSVLGPQGQPIGPGLTTEGQDYAIQPDSGAIYYKNGVIADPNSGNVYFPPSASVAGSSVWLRDAQKNWSEDDVKKWKEKLVNAGYLPKGSQKTGGWDSLFQNRLVQFQRDKYLNYGLVTPLSPEQGGYGPGGAAGGNFTNLRTVRGGIEQDVRTQYRTMFGEDPTPAELDRWIEFVIRTGNKLQRQQQLAAGAGASEAEARMQNQLYESPAGQFKVAQDENTQLRDSFVSAARAASAVSRGY